MEHMRNSGAYTAGASIENLVIQAREKDQNAISALYQLSQPHLRQAVCSLVSDSYEVEDIMQDSFLLAIERLDQLKQPAAFIDWLTQIATNQSKNYLAKKHPIRFTDLEDNEGRLPENLLPSREPSIETRMERGEIAATINTILSVLSASERSVICYYYYDQFSVKEIAKKMHISGSSVRVLMHRGRKKAAARIQTLEKQGMYLYGLAPFPFLLMLMKTLRTVNNSTPTTQVVPGANTGHAAHSADRRVATSTYTTKATASIAGRTMVRAVLLKGIIAISAAAACLGIAAGIYEILNSQTQEHSPSTEMVNLQKQTTAQDPTAANMNELPEITTEAVISTTDNCELLYTEDISLYETAIQGLLETETVCSSQMDGRLYDLNGDGIRELVILYSKMADRQYMGYVSQEYFCFCNVYTLKEGEVISLIKDEKVLFYAGTNTAMAELREISGEIKLIVWASGGITPHLANRNYLEADSVFTVFSFDGEKMRMESKNKVISVWTVAEESGGIGTDQFVDSLSYCVLDGEQSSEQIIDGLGIGDVLGERLPYSQYQAWFESSNRLEYFVSEENNGLFNASPDEMLVYFQGAQEAP